MDSESCTVQPQLAGSCQTSTGGGSHNRCDFSDDGCPVGESCQTGGGCPKYGDYNGLACAGDYITAAWTSATAPAGLPPAVGLDVFSSTLFIGGDYFADARAVLNDFAYDAGGWRVDKHPRMMGDVDGDGRADIVAFGDAGVYVALGRADGSVGPPQFKLADFGYDAGGWRVDKHPRFLADVNGDGRADIVGFGDAGVYVALGRADGGFDPVQFRLADFGYEAGGWRVDRHPRLLADVNGDGRADIVGFGDAGVYVALGRADGGFDPAQLKIADLGYVAGGWRVDKHPRLLADVNGDGRADIVAFGDWDVFVALGRADGGFDPIEPQILDLAYEAGGWRTDKHVRLLADVNGDGGADIVAFGDEFVFVAPATAVVKNMTPVYYQVFK
jgi:hypothetical protein